jgi:hypothetical protein
MYEMNDKIEEKSTKRTWAGNAAKECAYLAVFVALVIAVQLVLYAIPGVELVTVLFVTYAFVFGWKRGVVAATVFSLLRQLVFGVYPEVLILYLVYFNLLAALFGVLGGGKIGKKQKMVKILPVIMVLACLGTVFFHLFDNILTPLWYGYTQRAAKAYFYASLPFMIPQVVCTAVSVGVLFYPLVTAFAYIKKGLRKGAR